jgi:hypothetical protein
VHSYQHWLQQTLFRRIFLRNCQFNADRFHSTQVLICSLDPKVDAPLCFFSLYCDGHRHSLTSFEVDRDFAELQTMGGCHLKSYGGRKALHSLKGRSLITRQLFIYTTRHSASLTYGLFVPAHHNYLHHRVKLHDTRSPTI